MQVLRTPYGVLGITLAEIAHGKGNSRKYNNTRVAQLDSGVPDGLRSQLSSPYASMPGPDFTSAFHPQPFLLSQHPGLELRASIGPHILQRIWQHPADFRPLQLSR